MNFKTNIWVLTLNYYIIEPQLNLPVDSTDSPIKNRVNKSNILDEDTFFPINHKESPSEKFSNWIQTL